MKEKNFLRNSDDYNRETEREIGADIRDIMNGKNVRRRSLSEEGPSVYPGMEDAGIGSRKDYIDEIDELPDIDLSELDPDYESEKEEPVRKPAGKGPYLFISYAFVLIFLLLIGQIIYFNIYQKDEILNSPYNKRQNSLSARIIRGDILSSDGKVLAHTEVDDEGNETRVYPYANEYAHTVGYATHGKSGIESIANYQLLTSHNNIVDQFINDFMGKKNPGDTVVSTLNSEIQDAAWEALGDYQGAVIVMDPKDGSILAMVSKPNFDPNTLADVWDEMISDSSNSQLLNRATQGLYPPGSVFKIVTSLAYYRKYRNFDDFFYHCTGSLDVGNITVHCFHETEHGDEDFTNAFAHSCNTAFSQIGLDVGAEKINETAKLLLFDTELPCELNCSKSRWYMNDSAGDPELVQTAFGQGQTLVTPYHMLLLTAAIANDGVLMEPHLIKGVQGADGSEISVTKASKYKKLLTDTEAGVLIDLMKEVVNEGSASELSYRDYQVAGKTGSAEYTKSDGSIGTHSWFVGIADPDDPDYVIAVLAENGGAGSATAVPIAGRVLDACYN